MEEPNVVEGMANDSFDLARTFITGRNSHLTDTHDMNEDCRDVKNNPSSLVVSAMFCELEELAYQCDVTEAPVHLRKAKKAFLSSKAQSRKDSSRQTLINEYWT